MIQPRGGDRNNSLAEAELDPVSSEELALDGEERLPWLESDDDYEPEGVDPGRIAAFAAVGLLAVVLLVGALWWFLRDAPEEERLADGGVIEAPDEPYRVAPENRGGRQVAGTGDTSFEVAEGETVDTRIAGSGVVPKPSIDRTGSPEDEASPTSTGVGVQVGAYSSNTAAQAGWSQLTGRIAALQGRNHRVVEGVADSGTIFRLQALAGSVAEAETLCRDIKAQGGDCQVKR
jgi:hypothetical protein